MRYRYARLPLIMALVALALSICALVKAFAVSPAFEAEPLQIAEPAVEVIFTTPDPVPEPSVEFEPELMLPLAEPSPEFISLGDFTLTAYCPCVRCCEIWSAEHPSRIGTDYVQRTASGALPQAGRTIAADTNVLPFGTVVYIDDHEYVVEDRGGAIKGNAIDIFFDTHDEAKNFGRQTHEVFIKKED